MILHTLRKSFKEKNFSEHGRSEHNYENFTFICHTPAVTEHHPPKFYPWKAHLKKFYALKSLYHTVFVMTAKFIKLWIWWFVCKKR